MKSILLFIGFAVLVACNSNKQNKESSNAGNTDSTDMALVENTNNKDWEQKDIMEFIEKASSGGLIEVQLGQAAQKNAVNQQVKDLGKMIAKEHEDANTQLTAALKAMQLNAPAALADEYKNKVEKVSKKQGNEFDKEYVDFLVDEHEEDIEDFEKAQTSLPESELKTWVSNTLPVLRKHLAEAKYIQKQLKNDNKK